MKEVAITILVSMLLLAIIVLIKNEVTYCQQMRLAKAIKEYQNMCREYGKISDVDYDDMENYECTLFRLWDWGYTRILPKDKLEIIKPYIKFVR